MPTTGRGKFLNGWFGRARRRQGFAQLYADSYQESAASVGAWRDWFFDGAPSGGTTLKVWDGASFVAKPTKVWGGASWVEKPVKVWNGSTWV